MNKKKVCIVAPVNNEQGNVAVFCERAFKAFEPINNKYEVEILFVDDGSKDNTLLIITELNKQDKRVKSIALSRNFGFQAAVLAGLKHTDADLVCIITAGLADPPELLADFAVKHEEGYEIVYGIRGKRPEPAMITGFRNSFYRTLKFVADTDIILNMSEISLFTRPVLETILDSYNQFPFIRSDIAYAGFNRIGIPYDIQPRHSGKSHYNLWRMTKFAVAGILSISTYPLRFFVYAFPVFVLLNLLLIGLDTFFSQTTELFFHWLVMLDFVYIVSTLMFIGIYVARIYKNVVKRPIYVVDWTKTSL